MSFPAPPKSKTTLPESLVIPSSSPGSTPKHSVPPTPTTMPPDVGISKKDHKIPDVGKMISVSRTTIKPPVVAEPTPTPTPTPSSSVLSPPHVGRCKMSPLHRHVLVATDCAYGLHAGYSCDHCGKIGVGVSYHCKDCRFDLCDGCSELTGTAVATVPDRSSRYSPIIRDEPDHEYVVVGPGGRPMILGHHGGGGILVGPHPGMIMGHHHPAGGIIIGGHPGMGHPGMMMGHPHLGGRGGVMIGRHPGIMMMGHPGMMMGHPGMMMGFR